MKFNRYDARRWGIIRLHNSLRKEKREDGQKSRGSEFASTVQ